MCGFRHFRRKPVRQPARATRCAHLGLLGPKRDPMGKAKHGKKVGACAPSQARRSCAIPLVWCQVFHVATVRPHACPRYLRPLNKAMHRKVDA
jgi:hypothetical protein